MSTNAKREKQKCLRDRRRDRSGRNLRREYAEKQTRRGRAFPLDCEGISPAYLRRMPVSGGKESKGVTFLQMEDETKNDRQEQNR